jgi:hypothetical protein
MEMLPGQKKLFSLQTIFRCMIKSGSIGSLGLVGSGHFLTFLMDWGPNFEWNTFLKFENPSTGSKFRQFLSFFVQKENG